MQQQGDAVIHPGHDDTAIGPHTIQRAAAKAHCQQDRIIRLPQGRQDPLHLLAHSLGLRMQLSVDLHHGKARPHFLLGRLQMQQHRIANDDHCLPWQRRVLPHKNPFFLAAG